MTPPRLINIKKNRKSDLAHEPAHGVDAWTRGRVMQVL